MIIEKNKELTNQLVTLKGKFNHIEGKIQEQKSLYEHEKKRREILENFQLPRFDKSLFS